MLSALTKRSLLIQNYNRLFINQVEKKKLTTEELSILNHYKETLIPDFSIPMNLLNENPHDTKWQRCELLLQ